MNKPLAMNEQTATKISHQIAVQRKMNKPLAEEEYRTSHPPRVPYLRTSGSSFCLTVLFFLGDDKNIDSVGDSDCDASYVLTCSEYVDATSFSFGGSELARGASSSKVLLNKPEGLFQMTWRNLESCVMDESPTEGFNPGDLLKLCFRCAKLPDISDIVLVRSDLNASWSSLLANHTAILAAEDTFGSSVPSVKRANDVEGSADDVNDDQERVDLPVILLPHVLPTNPDRAGSSVIHKTLIFLSLPVLLKVADPASELDTLKEN
ncbi:hypothetical protein Tco_1300417 [Tanacetum coccineum]